MHSVNQWKFLALVLPLVFVSACVSSLTRTYTAKPTIPSLNAAKIPLRVALVITNDQKGLVLTRDGHHTCKGVFHLGSGLGEAAPQLYRQVFRDVQVVSTPPVNSTYDLVITPAIRDLNFYDSLCGSDFDEVGASQTVSTTMELLVTSGEKTVMRKSYVSAPYTEYIPYADLDKGADKIAGQAMMDNLTAGLYDLTKDREIMAAVSGFGDTLFLKAAESGDTRKVTEMLLAGESPNRTDRRGWTLLMTASFTGREDMVRLLLSVGADVNQQALDGSTALMMAAIKGHKDVAEILMAKGADPKLTMKNGMDALSLAKEQKKESLIVLLQNQKTGTATNGGGKAP